jgi:hypothetical protein
MDGILVSWSKTISGHADRSSDSTLPHLIESFRPRTFQLQSLMLLFIDKARYTIHWMGHPGSHHTLYIIFAVAGTATTGCRHVHGKHHSPRGAFK